MPGGFSDGGEGCFRCGKQGHFARECPDWRGSRRDQEDITRDFKTWTYGSTQGGQGSHGGYTDYQDPHGFGGKGGGKREELPSQEETMPLDVAHKVAKEEALLDKMPGVMVEAEDGSMVKDIPPDAPLPLPDIKPDPSRFDASLESILKGRNAAMWVNFECKKRNWGLEFEEMEAEGPVHDRTFSFSLTVGPENDSDDVIVTAGIAKNKKDAKKRCCDAMVLKMFDLPAAPPMPIIPSHYRENWRGRGFRGRGFFHPRGGFRPQGFQVESEETIFKKYENKAKASEHPSVSHPISRLCERAKKRHWPGPVWELVNEKVIDSKSHHYGRHNVMLYTMKVTVWPGTGTVEPRVYFGSGPTKKDAKFACGAVAWGDLEDDKLLPQAGGVGNSGLGHPDPVADACLDFEEFKEPMAPLTPAEIDKLDPEKLKQYLAQQAASVTSLTRGPTIEQQRNFKGFKRPDVDPDRWRRLVAKDLEREKEALARDREREARLARRDAGLIKQEVKDEPGCDELLRGAIKKEKESSSRERSRRSPTREGSRRRSRSREGSYRSSSTFSSRSSSSRMDHDDRDRRNY